MERKITVRRLVATTLAVAATAAAVPAVGLAGDGGGGPSPAIAAR